MKKAVWIFALAASLAAFSFGQAQQGPMSGDQSSRTSLEQAAGKAELILGYDVAPGSGQDISNYPTNSSLGYKGVVAGDFDDNLDANDELLVDFGSTGVWYYNGGTWFQESALNPQMMISVHDGMTPDDEVVVDFGGAGLWFWNNRNWYQISGANAEGMFAVDDDQDGDDEVQVDFGSLGVWRFDPYNWTWKQYTGVNPHNGWQTDYGTFGLQEGTWNFPSAGMWALYSYSTGSLYYHQLTGTYTGEDDFATGNFTASSGAKDLVADFASLGLWLMDYNLNWYKISNMSAYRVKEVRFVGNQDQELLVEDNAGGLYWGNWNSGTHYFDWTLITNNAVGPGWCETFDMDGTDSGDEEVVIPWASGGASVFDYSAGSTLSTFFNNSFFVNFMVKADMYGRGYKSTIITAFGSGSPTQGLHLYDKKGSVSTWISYSLPDGIY